MKKYLAIFVLFALIAGFSFAADQDTQRITIKSNVYSVKPVIQLKILSIYEKDDGQFKAVSLKSDEVGADNAVAVFSINKGGTVVFQALLTNVTKLKEKYTLTFGGGDFSDVVRKGESVGTRSPSSITTSIGTTIGGDNLGKGISSIEFGSSSDLSNRPIVVEFDGALDTTVFNVDEGVVLATAEYSYQEDPTIEAGIYYAEVTLTVSADQ